MSALLTTTGLTLLVGAGIVSLPEIVVTGGSTPPPVTPPPTTNWYDQVFAMRDGTGVGSRITSYSTVAAWDAATAGASDNGTTTNVSGAGVEANGVDFSGRLITWGGDTAHMVDCYADYQPGGGSGVWLMSGDDAVIEYTTIDNRTSPVNGSPPVFFHATTANGFHIVRNLWVKDAPTDIIKAPNTGGIGIEWCFFDGYYLGAAGVHLDYVDMKAASAGSYIRNTLMIATIRPTSPFDASTPSTGMNAMIRCVPSDPHGYNGSGRTYENLILVGSSDPFCASVLLSPTGAGATGVRMYDILYDLREHNSLLDGQVRVEDWYVRPFDYAASVAAGQITGIGAPVPFPNLANQPAAVPSTMAAPVITAVPGGFIYDAMPRPMNQRSLITGYTVEWSVNGTAWTAVAGNLAGGFIATGAATNVRARVYATNGIGNSTVSAASNILPTITAATIALTALPFDGFIFDANGTDSATGVLRGTGTAGAYVEARGEGAGSNTAWVQTIIAPDGTWAASIPLNANAGEWYTPVVQIQGSTATKVTGTNLFAGGDVHAAGPMQSESEYTMNPSSFYNGNAYPTLLAPNLTMLTLATTGGTHVARRITSTGINTVNVAMVALANLMHRLRPGRKFLILDLAISGQGRQAVHSDANTGYMWSDVSAPLALIRGAGGEVGSMFECYYNANASTIKTFGLSWAPYYFGQRWGGGAFTQGTPNPDDAAGNVDHMLWDYTAAPDAYGRGAFKRGRTKMHLMLPMPFHDTKSTEQVNFSTDSTGNATSGAMGRIFQLDRGARDAVLAFAADSRVQTFLANVGPSAHIVDFDGGIHPLPNSQWGTPQYAMQVMAPPVLRQAGYAVFEPTIDYANVIMGPSGAYADIPVLLGPGMTLTTLRSLLSLAAPSVEPPHYQPVVGFEIRRPGDTDAQRRPVMKNTETTYPANYRGTVAIVDSGSGTPRKGWVRITPGVAFTSGTMLEYLRGEANGHIQQSRDVAAQLFLDMLIGHVPAMYFPADTYPYYGVPVRPQPPMMTLP